MGILFGLLILYVVASNEKMQHYLIAGLFIVLSLAWLPLTALIFGNTYYVGYKRGRSSHPNKLSYDPKRDDLPLWLKVTGFTLIPVWWVAIAFLIKSYS
ncbi:hypothetical protein [Synechococcus sp. MU1625]|uniref:hypothetical protein n=1 Tax=Synechococcus sp. MU1625 TaxID=2508347 RepID=UPI001CF898AA|nr:hypothetical protein [Synechococcus sp. MU1625]MCB4399304.1 hypothetical protein [Synechococcus sp. MU1625]